MQLNKVYPKGKSKPRTPGRKAPQSQPSQAKRPEAPYQTSPAGPVTAGATSLYPMPSRRRVKLSRSLLSGVSSGGVEFLKCAFAPPDFNVTQIHGVPDAFDGLSLTKKHKYIGSVALAASSDQYYLLSPVPGISHFFLSKPYVAGVPQPVVTTDVWSAVPYGDYTSLFGTSISTAADIVNRFRFVSNHIELVPTTNAMQWTGNIQVWKSSVTMQATNSSITAGAYTPVMVVQGLSSAVATNAIQYTAPFNLGTYACAFSTNPVFNFQAIIENQQTTSQVTGGFGNLSAPNGINLSGMDSNFESVFIKISGAGTNGSNTLVLKTWACVEYQCLPGNALYEFQSVSPCDDLAMKLYRKIIKELPVAVTYFDNENFWERVLSIIQRLSTAGSFIPGQVGAFSKGVSMAATALQSL